VRAPIYTWFLRGKTLTVGSTGDDMSDQLRQVAKDGGEGPAWDRLEDQLGWYDRKSVAAQQAYKRVKLSQLIVGAAVPVVAALQVSAAVTATLAAFVVVARVPNSCINGRPIGCCTAPPQKPLNTRSISILPMPVLTAQITGTVFWQSASRV
jgi:hypothetical protein